MEKKKKKKDCRFITFKAKNYSNNFGHPFIGKEKLISTHTFSGLSLSFLSTPENIGITQGSKYIIEISYTLRGKKNLSYLDKIPQHFAVFTKSK